MKLKEFVKTFERSGRPYLRFTKTGLFTITKPLMHKIGLKPEDHLKFFQDENNPKD